MDTYVLTYRESDDTFEVLGVYTTLDGAQQALPSLDPSRWTERSWENGEPRWSHDAANPYGFKEYMIWLRTQDADPVV